MTLPPIVPFLADNGQRSIAGLGAFLDCASRRWAGRRPCAVQVDGQGR